MSASKYSPGETMQLQAKQLLKVLDIEPEERFDRYTRLACKIFDVPIALVTLVDRERQWFKSRYGIDVSATPREFSFCGLPVPDDEVLVVSDTQNDARFRDNPMLAAAPNMRFYAGCPLRGPAGEYLGTFCLIDREPRAFGADDVDKFRELSDLVEVELSSTALATTDELTKISNRRGFMTVASHVIAMCDRVGHTSTLVMFDLNGFKAINDDLGHDLGDQALQDFARSLLKNFRESDVVARLGGDEFCVLMSSVGADAVDKALARLDQHLAQRNRGMQEKYALRYSAGVVYFDRDKHADIEALLREADQRMYDAKRQHQSDHH
ncbi:MAG: sensor domain-containing diguanylate cyclase [Gammaproteobacteria bacterium]|nr:sensor domain-containing diguanylate cyclase [Gammaproteobacteria bacterium]